MPNKVDCKPQLCKGNCWTNCRPPIAHARRIALGSVIVRTWRPPAARAEASNFRTGLMRCTGIDEALTKNPSFETSVRKTAGLEIQFRSPETRWTSLRGAHAAWSHPVAGPASASTGDPGTSGGPVWRTETHASKLLVLILHWRHDSR